MAIIEDRLALLETLDLHQGGHNSFDEGHCAMEVVAWLAGRKHSDKPPCVCPVIGAVMRSWNDELPDDATRNRILKPLLPHLIGTAVKNDDVLLRRMWMMVDWQIRVYAPAFLSAAGLNDAAEKLAGLPAITTLDRLNSAEPVASAAESAARSAARSAAESAARSAAESAARSAAWSAANETLAPTVATLQDSLSQLILRMCEAESA